MMAMECLYMVWFPASDLRQARRAGAELSLAHMQYSTVHTERPYRILYPCTPGWLAVPPSRAPNRTCRFRDLRPLQNPRRNPHRREKKNKQNNPHFPCCAVLKELPFTSTSTAR